jgi:hypothetical protein
VPEGKAVKNRVHIGVNLATLDDLDELVRLGARVVRPMDDDEPERRWVVMADPEANELCAFPPSSG